jgi:hypothetical protein
LAIGPEDWCKRRDGISAESALAPTATPAERLVAGVTDSARPIRRALCGRVRYEILVAEVRIPESPAEKGPQLIAEGLMAKLPALAKALAGRWRIVEMDVWDKDFLDLDETAHLTFKGAADGEIAFGALKGFLDVRYGTRDGSACAEFSWEGNDENDPASGRGWVILGTTGRLVGHF